MIKTFSTELVKAALDLTEGSDGNLIGRCSHPSHEDRTPSLSVKKDPVTGKFLVHCFACKDQKAVYQSAIDKIEVYKKANGIVDDDELIEPSEAATIGDAIDNEQQRLDKEKFVQAIWDQASTYTPVVSQYLMGRGLSGKVPPSIRQTRLEYSPKSGDYYDAMIAIIKDDKGKSVAIHRTYLENNPDGKVVKAKVESPKKGLGAIKGNAVHLMYEGEQIGDSLHLAEGIETGLAVKEPLKTAIVWAVLSAQNLLTVKIPATIKKLYLWADRDRSGAGEDWAEKAAKHFSSLGVQVFALVPPGPIPDGQKGIDWLELGSEAIVDAYNSATEFVVSEPWGQVTMPSGYSINKHGVFLEKVKADGTVQQVQVATGAVWLSGLKTDLSTGETEVEISWYANGRTMSRWLSRGHAFKRATLLEMAELQGFPVYDGIAGELAKFLAKLERANNLPITLVVRKPGWCKDASGNSIFITGPSSKDIHFHPEAAYRPYANALKPKGMFAKWLGVIRPVAEKYHLVLFALLAALAAPLLKILDAPNFAVDFWGRTSVGKTSLLQLIASVWGKPSNPGGLILSCHNTAIFSERIAEFYGNGLPIFFDDSQTANDKIIESIIYMLINGTGKGRGKPYSIKELLYFCLVLFATGERPLTERAYPGAKARVIEIYGSPFPGIDPTVLQELKKTLMHHHGFLGALFIAALLERNEQELRESYEGYMQQYQAKADHEIGYRFATYFATIRLVAEVLVTIPQMQWVEGLVDEALNTVWRQATVVIDETDMAQRALLGIAAWVESNQGHFATSKRKAFLEPSYGIIREREGYVAIIPHVLNKAMVELGIQSLAAVTEELKIRKLLLHAPGRNQKQVNIDPGRPVWCICILLSALYKQQEPEEPMQEAATPQMLATTPSVITVTCQQGPCTDKAILDLFGNQPQDIIRYKKGILDSIDRKAGRITIVNGDFNQNSWTSSMSDNLKSKVATIDDQSLKHLVDRKVNYILGNGGDIDDIVIIQ